MTQVNNPPGSTAHKKAPQTRPAGLVETKGLVRSVRQACLIRNNRCSLPDIDDRAVRTYHMRHRLSKRAFAITLTELSAMAAPATTGFR